MFKKIFEKKQNQSRTEKKVVNNAASKSKTPPLTLEGFCIRFLSGTELKGIPAKVDGEHISMEVKSTQYQTDWQCKVSFTILINGEKKETVVLDGITKGVISKDLGKVKRHYLIVNFVKIDEVVAQILNKAKK